MKKSVFAGYNNSQYQIMYHIMAYGLKGLNEVAAARHEAGYERNERLTPFVIMGTWYADSCGNLGRVKWEGKRPKPKYGFPLVANTKEWQRFLEDHRLTEQQRFMTMAWELPPAGMVCDVCGKEWTIDDVHEVVVSHREEEIPLDEFEGKTLREVEKLVGQRLKADVFLQSELMLRNPAYKGLKKHPIFPEVKMRDDGDDGWVHTADKDTYLVQKGDSGYFNVWVFRHEKCQRRYLEKEERKYFEEVFREAGFKEFELTTIPNEYCSCLHCAPWFRVRTELGLFKIGWRKRVINLQWGPRKKLHNTWAHRKIRDLFKDERTTLWKDGIHCWGKEKAIEYLKRIRNHIETFL